mmetsp:Transcript_7932/g.10545  ORF Transcript_7932/g.10545 Transcript_7932/m.10545 type:complete len:328 (-) Transcript_7932:255-1238(-)
MADQQSEGVLGRKRDNDQGSNENAKTKIVEERELKKSKKSSLKNNDEGIISEYPLSQPLFDVAGGNFVVTGGGQGLGKAVAESLISNGAAGVVIACRSNEQGETFKEKAAEISGNCKVGFVLGDLSIVEDCRNMIQKSEEMLGPIHGLVNAAGDTTRASLETATPEVYDRIMNTNTRGPYFMIQEVAKVMKKHKVQGSIVNIGSIAAHGGAPGISVYCLSKAAVNMMTKVTAQELKPHQIRVNSVNMGWTATDNECKIMTKERGEGWLDKADKRHPFQRLLRPVDIAATVGFLLSKASVMITGAIIDQHPEYINGEFIEIPLFQSNS